MKKTKILAIGIILSMTLSLSIVKNVDSNNQNIGVGVCYLAAKNGASDEGTALLGGAFAVESAAQGLLWGSVFGGPVGAAVGLGISL